MYLGIFISIFHVCICSKCGFHVPSIMKNILFCAHLSISVVCIPPLPSIFIFISFDVISIYKDDLRLYMFYNSISVLSGQWVSDNERLCAMEPYLKILAYRGSFTWDH